MPNWGIHLIIPLFALIILCKKENYKYALVLLPVAVFSDSDVLFNQHRGLFHNVFIPIAILLIAYIWKQNRTILLIIAFYTSSHLLLDIFNGGIAPFYPFDNHIAFINIFLQLASSTHEILFKLSYGFNENFLSMTSYKGNYEIIDSPSLGSIFLLVTAFFISKKSLEGK